MNYKCNAFTYENGNRRNREDAVVLEVDHLEDVYNHCYGVYVEGYQFVDVWAFVNEDWHFIGVFHLHSDLIYGYSGIINA